MAGAVLKVSYQDEIRRCHIEKEQIGYDDIVDTIAKLFPGFKDFKAKYFDEDGDACTFCKAAAQDFLAVSKARMGASSSRSLLLKLELHSQQVIEAKAQAEVEQNSHETPWELAMDNTGQEGQRLGGSSLADLKKRAFEAAERRRTASQGISEIKVAEMAVEGQRQELLGRLVEQYRRIGEDMPMGLSSSRASLEQLRKHLESIRLRQ